MTLSLVVVSTCRSKQRGFQNDECCGGGERPTAALPSAHKCRENGLHPRNRPRKSWFSHPGLSLLPLPLLLLNKISSRFLEKLPLPGASFSAPPSPHRGGAIDIVEFSGHKRQVLQTGTKTPRYKNGKGNTWLGHIKCEKTLMCLTEQSNTPSFGQHKSLVSTGCYCESAVKHVQVSARHPVLMQAAVFWAG